MFYTAYSVLLYTVPGSMKPLIQKYAMGSDWLGGPVCCDSPTAQCTLSGNVTPLTITGSCMCSGIL